MSGITHFANNENFCPHFFTTLKILGSEKYVIKNCDQFLKLRTPLHRDKIDIISIHHHLNDVIKKL